MYCNRLVLYGCGDFLNDYEGISGRGEFRDDLALMYFAAVSPSTRALVALEIVPLQIRRFRLGRPSNQDIDWLRRVLDRESRRLGASVVAANGRLALCWPSQGHIGAQRALADARGTFRERFDDIDRCRQNKD